MYAGSLASIAEKDSDHSRIGYVDTFEVGRLEMENFARLERGNSSTQVVFCCRCGSAPDATMSLDH